VNHPPVRSRQTYRSPWPTGPWPDEAQLSILQAALLEDLDSARLAWSRWRSGCDFDRMDAGSRRLLPLLSPRIQQFSHTPAELEEVLRVTQEFSRRFEQQRARLLEVLRALQAAGIQTLLLKGAALNLEVYPQGLRPMADLDVMVPQSQLSRALEVLQEIGWTLSYRNPLELTEISHAVQLVMHQPPALDLHWDLLHARTLTEAQLEQFWGTCEPVKIEGVSTATLGPAQQLLHTAVHGTRYTLTPPVRWLADAALIVRQAGVKLDWDQLVDMSQKFDVVPYVRSTLSYLADHLDIPVPERVRRHLWNSPISPATALEYELAVHQPQLSEPVLWLVLIYVVQYWRYWRTKGRLNLPLFLQRSLQLDESIWTFLHRRIHRQLGRLRNRAELLAWRCRRLLLLRPPLEVFLADTAETWRVQGFHELELSNGHAFRWSKPAAALTLPAFSPGLYRLELRLTGARSWSGDLADHFELKYNGSAVPRSNLQWVNGCIVTTITAGREDADPRLGFSCRPAAGDGGDPRALGIPLHSVRLFRC
jgi:hypothetical protein